MIRTIDNQAIPASRTPQEILDKLTKHGGNPYQNATRLNLDKLLNNGEEPKYCSKYHLYSLANCVRYFKGIFIAFKP